MKTKYFNFNHKTALRSFATLLIAAAALPVPAFADLCQSPHITINNQKIFDMEVRKIKYLDGCDGVWRTEDVPNTEINAGDSETFHDDLEYVGNCPIEAFQLFRRVDGSNGWTSVIWGNVIVPNEGDNVVCNTEVRYTLDNP